MGAARTTAVVMESRMARVVKRMITCCLLEGPAEGIPDSEGRGLAPDEGVDLCIVGPE
jgi:hypothetical protein